MKKLIGYIATALVAFAGGAAAGYIFRKKTTEAVFEEISEDEQLKQIAEGTDDEEDPITRPKDIQEAIDRHFVAAYNPPETSGVVQIDTQKERYFKQWKAEEAAEKYDTRTKEDPEHPVASDDEEDDLEAEMDPEFLKEAKKELPRSAADIEPATMEDWDHWLGIQDGDYDCIEIWWYDGDNVLTDEHNGPLENPGKFLGFDVEKIFRDTGDETTGDPDIRVVYNHHEGAIFQVIRKHGSYGRIRSMEEFGDDGEDEDEHGWIHSRNE